MRPSRLLARTVWLALPVTLALAGLLALQYVRPGPGLVAWAVGLIVSGGLAWLREHRLEATGRYLEALAGGREPEPLPDFGVLGDDELATALHRLDRALAEERARKEETDRMLEAVLDALPDPLLLVSSGHRVDGANRAAARLFGQDPVGRPIEASLRAPGILAAVDQALAGYGEVQLTVRLPGETTRAFGASVVPIEVRGQPAVLVGLRELTEQLMIERMRSDFVANASHELRTPLAALRGFIETLAGPARDDAETRDRFLATMAAEAERMSRLVHDLLSLSRIELLEHQPPEERVDVAECLDGVVNTLQGVAERRGATIRLDPGDRRPRIAADRDQLIQLLTNLIDNAIKYGGDGGVAEVGCEVMSEAPPGAGPLTGRSAVRITIRDHGPGIAREHLPRLTERFFRIDAARSRQLGGTGLGLAIVKHILRRHRGHLSIESELGEGTTVSVFLPATEGRPSPPSPIAAG
jgi:two-component system phosphate regulon sensor histidine kinase PhoR